MILFWASTVIITLAVLSILIFSARLRKKEIFMLVLFVFVFSLSMYMVFGAYPKWSTYLDQKKQTAQVQKEIQSLGSLENIIQKMEERVHQNQDARGWFLLGRLYMRVGRFQDAVEALDQANQRAPNQPETLATYAEALDLARQQQKEKELVQAHIQIPVSVSLSPTLKEKIKGTEILFIYAKADKGSNAPLAIIKAQAKDLPMRVVLDETMAMLPTATLRNVVKVRIVARISLSGEPIPKQGDLQGESPIIHLKALPGEVRIVIDKIRPNE
jgi:tetratricopeptide (TPR) repeat protein